MYQVFYDGTFNGLLTLYDYFDKGLEIETVVNRAIEKNFQPYIFQFEVETDRDIADSVTKKILLIGGEEVLKKIYLASLADSDKNEIIILDYIKLLFTDIELVSNLSIETVIEIEKCIKRVFFERHKMLGFIRFSELYDGTMVSFISPKYNVLSLLGGHFKRRFPDIRWAIFDKKRGMVGYYFRYSFEVSYYESIDELEYSANENKVRDVWKVFFDSIAIKERLSYERQVSKVPLRVREDMLEFGG
ncbi:MAG: TIGR03915 family putative DNA repair protein [Calditerrivibrio sp.]|nr:TIGR03915 family putative DNA repair protein [Calditerrivibrio sp.]MCA1933166.1 TIGR03915 family putative DNA repair protein [Calditerrivibrio sp.]MCA1980105.1 TIGR03915 family putative DNA repair protein [Calditerrivibrio sp.]